MLRLSGADGSSPCSSTRRSPWRRLRDCWELGREEVGRLNKALKLCGAANLRVDEIDGLRLQLISAVKIRQYQRLGCCLHRQINAQRLLTHHFELLQSVLERELRNIRNSVTQPTDFFSLLPYRRRRAGRQPFSPSWEPCRCRWSEASPSGPHGPHLWWQRDSVSALPSRVRTSQRRQDFELFRREIQINFESMRIFWLNLPAKIALWAWNSRPPTDSVTSLNFSLSNRLPKSSDSLHSGTLNWIMLLCPDIFTLSATTLTYNVDKSTTQRRERLNEKKRENRKKNI